MTVRVTFRSEVYIDADSVADAKAKFEAMELYSEKAKKEIESLLMKAERKSSSLTLDIKYYTRDLQYFYDFYRVIR